MHHFNRLNTSTDPGFSKLNANALNEALDRFRKPLLALRHVLKSADIEQKKKFFSGESVEKLIRERACIVDGLIKYAARYHLRTNGAAVIAVGGYGRGELHPHSDIDILILLRSGNSKQIRSFIEEFIAFLWDIGLQVSHSVRTLEDCLRRAKADLTIITNLMEARLLTGDMVLFKRLINKINSKSIWPSEIFLDSKLREQRKRHAKYHNTAYRLEPNIKEGPGGLRDIQMLAWLTKWHFHLNSLSELAKHGFLTQEECQSLLRGQTFLWRIRFAMHLFYGRREDRLLFDAQVKIANQFGYHDTAQSLAVEQLMQSYYKTVNELSLLNEMLIQLFEEAIIKPDLPAEIPLNEVFSDRASFLHLRDVNYFAETPSTIFEIFLELEQRPHLRGLSAETLRALRKSLHLIDAKFRDDPINHKLFLRILRAPRGVTHELRRMNKYGVLGQYIPAFNKIVGRMQYDLFHAYTVDEHILFVISNLRRFALTRYDHEFPLCSRIMQNLPNPELAYLAALFHDIAKGQLGDHSTLGADEALIFCLSHGLSRHEARLVSWLVQNHLLLSLTAQKKDINDPQIVHAFAQRVSDQIHLDYLYLLTVADIRATNPELWNAWKASLCVELYQNASRCLRQGLETPIDKDEIIREAQLQALQKLKEQGTEQVTARNIWNAFPEEYFLHYSWQEIVWHTRHLAMTSAKEAPLVFLRQQGLRGSTVICLRSSHDDFIFGRITAALAELGLTVLDARMTLLTGSSRLDTYAVLEDNGEPILDIDRLDEIEHKLRTEAARHNGLPLAITRRAPRQVRMFTSPTLIQFADDHTNRHTILEISASDRPGLLSLIGEVFGHCQIRLHNAKITTVGERAEDVFFITDSNNQPLIDRENRENLRARLLAALDELA